MAKKSDPKEDPQFKGVVQHFLKTKPQPHKSNTGPVGSAKAKKKKPAS